MRRATWIAVPLCSTLMIACSGDSTVATPNAASSGRGGSDAGGSDAGGAGGGGADVGGNAGGSGGAEPSCDDSSKNGDETDVDCGGSCKPCGSGDDCNEAADCESHICDGTCVNGGGCAAILEADRSAANGVYPIDPDGEGGEPPLSVYCDMTDDAGGWILIATLKSHDQLDDTTAWDTYSEDWFTIAHGDPSDPMVAFSNHDVRRFRPLIADNSVLRATNPVNSVKRFHFGMTQDDWDLWNDARSISGITVVGPFNLNNVMVSISSDLTNPVQALSNGNWASGVFYLGTGVNQIDADTEGIGARYHVGSNSNGMFGFVGEERVDTRWHLWLK